MKPGESGEGSGNGNAGKLGDGGTAAILVEEFNNGSSTHLQKAIERLGNLNDLANTGQLELNDMDVLEALRNDLEYAINLFK